MGKKTKREDANQAAFRTLQEATGQTPKTPAVPAPDPTKNPAAVALSDLVEENDRIKGGLVAHSYD